jgi:hypothetical protein
MRLGTLRGISILVMLLGTIGAGVAVHAAPAINMAKLCSNGAYVLYMDDNGDEFETESACVTWTRQHPGQPPISMDNDPNDHPNPSDGLNPGATDNQPDDSADTTDATDDADDTTDASDTTDTIDTTDDDTQAQPTATVVVVLVHG